MGRFTDAAKNAMLDALAPLADFCSLHSGDPGTSGANEISGGSPAYARKAISWGAAASGNINSAVSPVFDVPAGTTVSRIGFWSALTGGTFYGWAPLGGGTRKVFNTDDIGTDVLDAEAHGFTDGQQVLLFAGTGGLPGGLVEGTIYFVRDATTDTLKLAATAGGAAIDLTSIGNGLIQRIIPETFGSQGTYTATETDLNLNAP